MTDAIFCLAGSVCRRRINSISIYCNSDCLLHRRFQSCFVYALTVVSFPSFSGISYLILVWRKIIDSNSNTLDIRRLFFNLMSRVLFEQFKKVVKYFHLHHMDKFPNIYINEIGSIRKKSIRTYLVFFLFSYFCLLFIICCFLYQQTIVTVRILWFFLVAGV